jgi:maltose O-acetyltransferase
MQFKMVVKDSLKKMIVKADGRVFPIKKIAHLICNANSSSAPVKNISGAVVSGNFDNISIGERVTFGGNVVLFANAPITIGNDVMIAMRALILTSTHDHTNHPMWLERVDAPITIGNHVWIGAGAIILPGVIISDYAVIGAGAVVSANVPKGAVVVGNPARIIKYRDCDAISKKAVDKSLYPGKLRKEGFKERVIS